MASRWYTTKTGEYKLHINAFNKRKVMAKAAKVFERGGKQVTNSIASMLELEPEMALLMTEEIQRRAADGSYTTVPKSDWRALFEEHDQLVKIVMEKGEELASERDAEFEVASGN